MGAVTRGSPPSHPGQWSAAAPPRPFLRLPQRLPGSQACLRLQLHRAPRPPPRLPARRPAEPVSSGAPAARCPAHGVLPATPLPPRAAPRASPQPAAAPGRARAPPPASRSPSEARRLPRAPRVPHHPYVQWLSRGGERGASPRGEEPRPGWGVRALRGQARLACPAERVPGLACASVCARECVRTRLQGLE